MKLAAPSMTWTLLLTACGQGGEGPSSIDKDPSGVAVPQAIRAAGLPDVTLLRAYLRIDGGDTRAMPIVDNQAKLLATDLPEGQHSFHMAFAYESVAYGYVTLANSTKIANLVPGGNSVEFADADFAFPDSDLDGVDNLLEINSGTNPIDPLKSGLVVGYADKCLDVRGPASANGTDVQMWTCEDPVVPQQQWLLTPEGELRGFHDKCLDIRGPSAANGTAVQIWDCVGVPN
ncbi:MAG: RICIN domain-containing protein, partial [Pseudomonadales bacterium]